MLKNCAKCRPIFCEDSRRPEKPCPTWDDKQRTLKKIGKRKKKVRWNLFKNFKF